MEITKREILFSVIIFFMMITIGVFVNSALTDSKIQDNDTYNKALKINAEESLFKQAMNTNFGNAFVYGELSANTPVSYEDIGGEYSYIKQDTQKYTRHTRLVTRTRTVNGKTQTYTETEVYWTWDTIQIDSRHTDTYTFLGVTFPYEKFSPPINYIGTIDAGYHLRHVYYASPAIVDGTVYTVLKDGTISDNSNFTCNSLDKTVESYIVDINSLNTVFWVCWIVLTGIVIFAFLYYENTWLED